MRTAALAGILVLAAVGFFSMPIEGLVVPPATAQEFAPVQDITITETHIARLKAALKLTLAQEQHWRPVEAALRALVRTRGPDEATEGAFQRVRARVVGTILNAGGLRRLASVARPLIASLDENQKQDGLMVIRSMGLASLL
jgi:hypothetical protein